MQFVPLHYDIKMVAHVSLAKLCVAAGRGLLQLFTLPALTKLFISCYHCAATKEMPQLRLKSSIKVDDCKPLAAGSATLAALDTLVEPMGKTLTAKLKSDAVKQEIDRNEDLLRSCLRAVAAVEKLEGAAENAAFAKFLEKTVMVGLSLFTHVILQSKHHLVTASMFHVSNRVTPGSDDASRAHGRRHRLMTAGIVHVTIQ